ncbi:MAG: S-methyl-5'-thioadenosine phosphorylase [Gammaproteobacteria bacterium]|nr:S-methyl-5'-thioadenosine phosphorylase [Gammaproteobacteria bacterium]
MKNKLAIIGGSGLYQIDGLEKISEKIIKTPWGEPSDKISIFKLDNKEILFLPRHGTKHTISPTHVNYRANIDALKQLGTTDIISVSAVGSLKDSMKPGDFVLVDQFIDRTFARNKSFFGDGVVAHVSLAKPTSTGLADACESSLKELNINYHRGGTYLVMEGPQFSTLAESNMYRSWNADIIGMTNMPEAKLAREAEIRYMTVAMVTDYDCWHPDHENVEVKMIIDTLNKNANNAKNMVKSVIKNFENFIRDDDPATNCLDTAIITDLNNVNDEIKNKLKNILNRVLK